MNITYLSRGSTPYAGQTLPSGATIIPCTGHDRELITQIDTIIGKFTPATRWVITGDDELFSLTVRRIMFLGKLDHHEVAFVPGDATGISPIYHCHDVAGPARTVPLIRDDIGTVILSPQRIVGTSGPFKGESYVDEHKITPPKIRCVEMEPTAQLPGLRGRHVGKFRTGPWVYGRAMQTGGVNFQAVSAGREGADTAARVVSKKNPRITWYRHTELLRII